jgi:hypothetical protein
VDASPTLVKIHLGFNAKLGGLGMSPIENPLMDSSQDLTLSGLALVEKETPMPVRNLKPATPGNAIISPMLTPHEPHPSAPVAAGLIGFMQRTAASSKQFVHKVQDSLGLTPKKPFLRSQESLASCFKKRVMIRVHPLTQSL